MCASLCSFILLSHKKCVRRRLLIRPPAAMNLAAPSTNRSLSLYLKAVFCPQNRSPIPYWQKEVTTALLVSYLCASPVCRQPAWSWLHESKLKIQNDPALSTFCVSTLIEFFSQTVFPTTRLEVWLDISSCKHMLRTRHFSFFQNLVARKFLQGQIWLWVFKEMAGVERKAQVYISYWSIIVFSVCL